MSVEINTAEPTSPQPCIAGSVPNVCSLQILAVWKLILVVCVQILMRLILSQRLPILLILAEITFKYSISLNAALKVQKSSRLLYSILVIPSDGHIKS